MNLIAIGHNYKGTQNELPDCELDANNISELFGKYGYSVQTFTEMSVFKFVELLDNCTSDTVIYYSGHGTQLPTGDFEIEQNSRDEALCFWNGERIELLTDKQLNALINSFPHKITFILDCCHSEGMNRTVSKFQKRYVEFQRSMKSASLRGEEERKKGTILSACDENSYSYSTGKGGAFTNEFLKVSENRTIKEIVNYINSILKDQTAHFVGENNVLLSKIEAQEVELIKQAFAEVFTNKREMLKLSERAIVRIGIKIGADVSMGYTKKQNVLHIFKSLNL